MFFNMWTGTHNGQSVTPGERGTFYLGKDTGSLADFDPAAAGPPLFEVLAHGLDPAARWMGSFAHGQLDCQNGVDDAVAVQLDRTATPGKWRKRASNAKPNTPIISLIEPQSSLNTQATRVVTGRAGGIDLVFTANSDNFPGIYGNSKIKVLIQYAGAYSAGAITSSISGDGTASSPYIYTIFTTESNSSNNAIIAFVNADTNAIPILSASGANATTPDAFDDAGLNPTGVFLTNGSGTGNSIGLSNEVVDVYACYWDGGTRNLGYQGVKSLPSNEIIIDGTTNKDLLVQVDVDESAEGGRFSHAAAGIRIFKRFQASEADDPIWSMMNEGTTLPNTHRTKSVIGTSESSPMWVRLSEVTATFVALTNVATFSSPLTNGQVLMSLVTSEGVTSATRLYVINASGSNAQLSLSAGGSAIDLGSSYTATVADHTNDELEITGTVTNGQVVQIPSTSLGIPGATNLHVIDAVTALGVTKFKLSTTSGGAAIDVTGNGSVTIHVNGSLTLQLGQTYPNRLWSILGASVGVVSTVVDSGDTITTPLVLTNNTVVVAESSGYGIPSQTKLFVVNAQQSTPSVGSTRYQLSLSQGGAPIQVTSNGSIVIHPLESHQWSTTDIITIPSALGVTAPSSLALDTRYYIRSIESDGYGVTLSSSRLGDILAIGSNGSGASVKVVAVTMTIGSSTEPGRALPPDQNRPPAHRYITMSGSFNWIAGVTNNESNMLSSKEWQFDELDPEGVDLEDIDAISPKRSLGGNTVKVSGLWSDQQSLHVHFRGGIVIIDPSNTANTQEPMIDSGMMNGMCASNSDRNRIVFLGGDGRVMEFNGARYGDRSSRSKSDDALLYIKQYINDNLVDLNPEQCCILHDRAGEMFWFWMPSSGGSVGFAYDQMLDGIIGPFTSPCRLLSTCDMGSTLGTYIAANADGYLFYWDTFDQGEFGDKLTTSAPALHEAGDALPADHVGYDTSAIMVGGVAKTLHYSQRTILETGLIDLGDSSSIKKFIGVQWRSVSGSRAYIKVTFISSNGQERGVWYGEIGAKQRNRPHQVLINMVDTAIKVRFDVYSADLIPWVIRDIDLLIQ
jgi:hypothetical protein